MLKVRDAVIMHAEKTNKTEIQCDALTSKILIKNSVLRFMKMPKGIFIKEIKKAKTPKNKGLLVLKKCNDGTCDISIIGASSFMDAEKVLSLKSIFIF